MQNDESGLKVRLFGRMEVRRSGERINHFPYEKVKALLAYLLLEPPHLHRRERLAGLLWPRQTQGDARHSLRQALSQLRKTLADDELEPPLILPARTTIQRNPDAPLAMDVITFDTVLAEERSVAEVAPEALARAADVYRGKLIQGLSLVDAPAFQQWLQERRQHYHVRALTVLNELVERCVQGNRYHEALGHARRLVALEPWREDAQRRLILLLARTGQRGAALKQYERCRSQLRETLEAVPEPATERVYDRIQQMASARFFLPASSTPFIGRQRELETVLGVLRDPEKRLITIRGLGGIGKTRLAMAAGTVAARKEARMFLHGVVFVALDGIEPADQLVAKIAQSLNLAVEGDGEPLGKLLDFLEERELLLILDQFEHLVSKETLMLLSKIMQEAPDVQVLVTSRRRLGLRQEQVLPLAGLPIQDKGAGGHALAARNEGAVALFMATMSRVQPTVELTEKDEARVVNICRLVGGMPLAIELAASWTDVLSFREIERAVQQNLDLLTTSAPDMPARHRSIRAMFDALWQALEPEEQRVMVQVSLFRGGFTLEAAEAITGVSRPTLARLVTRSLVQHDAGSDRYHVHPLLRQYCRKRQAEPAPDLASARERHGSYYHGWLRQMEGELRSEREESALREMDAEIRNIRRAWQWAIEQGELDLLGASSRALYHYYRRRGQYQEGLRAFAAAAQRVRTSAQDEHGRIAARLLGFQADMLRRRGKVGVALATVEESLEILEHIRTAGKDGRRERAFAWWCMARLTSEAGRAHRLLEQSLALYRELGAHRRVATLLAELGQLYKSAGDLERAEACFEESLVLRQELAMPVAAVESFYYLAELRMRQGRHAESERLLQEGLALVRAVGDRAAEAKGLFSLGHHYVYVGRFDKAASAYRESMTIQEELGRRTTVSYAGGFMSVALMMGGEYARARLNAERIQRLARRSDVAAYAGAALVAEGGVLLAQGDADLAYRRFLEAVEAYAEGWLEDWRARQNLFLALAACALCHRGSLNRAATTLCRALQVVTEVRSLIALLSALPAAALLLLKKSQPGRAAEVWAAACTQPYVMNSALYNDAVGRYVEEATMSLDDDAAARARARGQEWDLWELAEDLLHELCHDSGGAGVRSASVARVD